MNSNTENLSASVIAILQRMELDKKKAKTDLDKAEVRAGNANMATQDAKENYSVSNEKQKCQLQLKTQVLLCQPITVNVLDSANQLRTTAAGALTDSSVAASNVQVANNAVVRLASDIAGIFSIDTEQDLQSGVSELCFRANEQMKDTAFLAEQTAELGMNSSVLTAEIIANTVADEAKKTADEMNTFLQLVQSHLLELQGNLAADTAALETTVADEKQAKGVLEIRAATHKSAKKVLDMSNKHLNLNLNVPEEKLTGNSFVIQFNRYNVPFFESEEPVQNYAVFLVKDIKKATFSFTNAEALLLDEKLHIGIPASKKNEIEQFVDATTLLDADGEMMEAGMAYVVFVLTVFTDNYKKAINNFDNCLSAPSAAFILPAKDWKTEQKLNLELKGDRSALLRQLSDRITAVQLQQEVCQAAVDLTTTNFAKCGLQFDMADFSKKKALENQEKYTLVLAQARNLFQLSELCSDQSTVANTTAIALSSDMKVLIDKLIVSVEIINKIGNIIVRKRAINPLISDELVSMVASAGKDSNNAVALTVNALKAVFDSQTSILTTQHTAALLNKQAAKLLDTLGGNSEKTSELSLKAMLNRAVIARTEEYQTTLIAKNKTLDLMKTAEEELSKICAELNSLQAGMAAAESV